MVLWEAAYPPLHGQMQEKGLQHLERPHPPHKHIVSPPPLRQEAAEHQVPYHQTEEQRLPRGCETVELWLSTVGLLPPAQ